MMPPSGFGPMPPPMPTHPMPPLDTGPPNPFADPPPIHTKGNAFSDNDTNPPNCCWYAGVGMIGLVRSGLGHGVIALLDPGNGTDTGILPPATAPGILRFSDLHPNMDFGTAVSCGYRFGNDEVEFTGYYLGLTTAARDASNPGKLDLPFSFFTSPLGFQGNNFLWLQADLVRVVQQTRLANAEFNYRSMYSSNFQWIAGLRYMDLQEQFSIGTDDDGIVLVQMGLPPNPFAQAVYSIDTHNRIVAPQIGLGWEHELVCWFTFSCDAKIALGPNFLSEDHLLLRGDGFQGPSSHSSRTLFSQIYDLGVYGTFTFSENFRIKAGYQMLWVAGIPVASQQVDFNPNNALGRRADNGSIFFQGPSVQFQFSF
jgi:hypothetical protein